MKIRRRVNSVCDRPLCDLQSLPVNEKIINRLTTYCFNAHTHTHTRFYEYLCEDLHRHK